jgi:hypothetical protein
MESIVRGGVFMRSVPRLHTENFERDRAKTLVMSLKRLGAKAN